MRIVTETAAAMQAVFGKYLDELSRTTGCVQRERKFSGMSLMRTFVLTLLQNPAAKDRDYRAMAAKLGVPVTEKAITLRFTDGLSRFFEESLKQAVAQTLAAKPAPGALLRKFTEVARPASQQAASPQLVGECLPHGFGAVAIVERTRPGTSRNGRCPDESPSELGSLASRSGQASNQASVGLASS